MEWAGQISGTACLVGQPAEIINFIREKISYHMEPSQLAFTIPSQSGTEPTLNRCSHEKVFWKYAANLQENTYG